MEYKAIVKKVGNSLIIRVPKYLADSIEVKEGDAVWVNIEKRRRADSRTE
jgi:antitoxin component of MazEF toxin-antitoxin module